MPTSSSAAASPPSRSPAPAASPLGDPSRPLTPQAEALFAQLTHDLLFAPTNKHHTSNCIVLYDAVCLVCNTTVHFIMDRDPDMNVHFAPLQSDYASFLLRTYSIPPLDSLILLRATPGKPASDASVEWFAHSSGILRILGSLHPKWLYAPVNALLLIPAPVRDWGYKTFARFRYRLFGTIEEGQDPADSNDNGNGNGASCRVITKATRKRFLEYVIRDRMRELKKKEKEAAEIAAADTPSSAAASIASPIPSKLQAEAHPHPSSPQPSISPSVIAEICAHSPSPDTIEATDEEIDAVKGHRHFDLDHPHTQQGDGQDQPTAASSTASSSSSSSASSQAEQQQNEEHAEDRASQQQTRRRRKSPKH